MAVIDVEQVVCPDFDAPAIIGAGDADTTVDQRVAVLFLAVEQVRTGVVIAGRTRIDEEQARQTRIADRRGPAERGGRGHFGGVRQIVAREQPECRIERRTVVAADQIVLVAGVRIGQADRHRQVADRAERGFELDALRDHAGCDIVGRAASRRRIAITVQATEVGVAAVDVLHEEDRAVERVQLEVLEFLAECGDTEAPLAARILHADFEGVDGFGIELQRARIEVVDVEGDRNRQRRTIEVEAAGLVALGVGAVDHPVGIGLPAQDGGAGEFVLVTRVGQRDTVELGSGIALA